MEITIRIATDNAAFEDNWYGEITTIFEKVAARIRDGEDSFAVRDSNGNKVGTVECK